MGACSTCSTVSEKALHSISKLQNSSKKIYIEIIKPTLNNENLVDFESPFETKGSFSIPMNSFTKQKHQEVVSCKIEPERTIIFKIANKKLSIDCIYLSDTEKPNHDPRCWVVLNNRFFSNYRISLSKGDVLKLGKIVFTVSDVQVNTHKKKGAKPVSALPLTKENSKESKKDQKTQGICKYCLEEETPENPLITPCKCSGTMGFVHEGCLKHWAKSKIKTMDNDCISIYCWEDLICDICKTSIPMFLDDCEITDKRPDFSFIAMQSYIEGKYFRFYVNFDKQDSFRIGRYVDCEIRINEISVSRHHSRVYVEDGEVFIEDLGSKYGTLLLYKEPLTMESVLIENEELCLEHCGLLMKFAMRKQLLAQKNV